MIPSFIFPLALAERALRHVFIRDFELDAQIGVHPSELGRTQPIRINLDLAVCETAQDLQDELENVVCYERIATNIRGMVASGHVKLVETLAERIAALCLEDARVRRVRVRVEKRDAIPGASGVGVEIERVSPL
jgi:dihydroneopterin aldolase